MERPTNKATAWKWIEENATCEQLKTFIHHPVPKAAKRSRLLDEIPFGIMYSRNLLTTAQSMFDMSAQKRQKLALERSDKSRPILEGQQTNKRTWHLLQEELKVGSIISVKIEPCVFHSWKRADSGPGASLIYHYREEKTKWAHFEIIRALGPFPTKKPELVNVFWSQVNIQARLKQLVTLQTLRAPFARFTRSNEWEDWTLSEGMKFQFDFQYPGHWWNEKAMWSQQGFLFSLKIDDGKATLSWDGEKWLIYTRLNLILPPVLAELVQSYL